jgi:tetratricopeptide (TPR) repeat protein
VTDNDLEALLEQAFALYEGGHYAEAGNLCRQMLNLDADFLPALHLEGRIAARSGDTLRAIAILRAVVAEEPEAAAAWIDLADLLKESGDLSEAISAYNTAIRLDPNAAGAHNNLGQAYLAENRLDEAIAAFQQSALLAPGTAIQHYNLGIALRMRGSLEEAVAAFTRAVALAPRFAKGHYELAELLLAQDQRIGAIAAYRKAAAAQPESTIGRLGLAGAKIEEGDLEGAEGLLRQLSRENPGDWEVHHKFATLLRIRGKFSEAIACLERALELQPRRTACYLEIVNSKKLTEADRPLIDGMRSLLEDRRLDTMARAALHHALAKASNDLGHYEQALRHYDQAKSLQRPNHPFDRQRHTAAIDRLIARYSAEFIQPGTRWASDSELPVLVIGMPRSGTTLIEQILSSHPAVAAGDELSFWPETRPAVDRSDEDLDFAQAYRIASEYLSVLRRISPTAERVIDKMPYNFLAVGLVQRIFPKARIIHCRRHPVDTCLSIYFTQFRAGHHYAFDPVNIVAVYEQYLRLMEHWRQVLPEGALLEVDYEMVVADRERMARRMIEFCGLDWDDACLRHEDNERAIKTASAWQARQPIYASSVERWRRYEPWLGEFRKLLPAAG